MSDHHNAEALPMLGLKRDLWKASIAIAGVSLLLVLMAWVPVSAAGAEMRASGLAAMVTVQATPTEDATVTALNKAQLTQQVEQQQHTVGNWLWSNAATILSSFLSTLVVVIGVLFGFWQWRVGREDAQSKESEARRAAQDKELEDRKAERERRDEEQQRWLKNQEAERDKRAEERFQSAVTGLGDAREGARIGAAILLRTFLRPGYEQFYTQTFDLAVAHLCPTRTSNPLEDPKTSLPLTILRQALIVAFKEAFPLARSQNKGSPQSLDASYIQLDNAYLARADLEQAWMLQASCQEAMLYEANLSGANLNGANLSGANLGRANLSEVHLYRAVLSEAVLSEAVLSGAYLNGANLSRANLSRTNLEDALSLKDTDLRGVKGLTKAQRASCKAKGAIIDEDPTTNSSQPTVAPPPSSQSNEIQAQSAPAAQGSIPTPETGESNAPSLKPGPQS